MIEDQKGVILEQGASDWQIFQQDASGQATLNLSGRWVNAAKGKVEVRLVSEDSGAPVNRSLNWQAATTSADGSWSATIPNLPAGGPYRLETRLQPDVTPQEGFFSRGDMRHFLGVGDIWIIAGQSNASGAALGSIYDPPEMGLHLFRAGEQWALATHPLNESTGTKHPDNCEAINTGHSPYLHLARLLKHELNYPIGLIPTAIGGTPLSSWNPTETGGAALFENMVQCAARAGGKIKGVFWYQGEHDTVGEYAVTYAERFINAVQGWRKALNNPDLYVITAQINCCHREPTPDNNRAWSILCEAQRQVPKRLKGVAVVPTLDLPVCDAIHNSTTANIMLAERMAHAVLGLVFQRQIDWQAPEPASARRLDNGKKIELAFSNVTSRMIPADPISNCFFIEDEAGEVPVEQVVYPLDKSVKLILERPLKGRAVIHGGYGIIPARVPVDADRQMPMLGFYGMVIE